MLIGCLISGTWFKFAERDVEIPETLWPKFEEMPLFFFANQILEEAVTQHIWDRDSYIEIMCLSFKGCRKQIISSTDNLELIILREVFFVQRSSVVELLTYRPETNIFTDQFQI